MSDNAGDQATMGRHPCRSGGLEEGIAFWVVLRKDHDKEDAEVLLHPWRRPMPTQPV
jgi:hypothetical protein